MAFAAEAHRKAADLTVREAREIAAETYVYLYPLVVMDLTRLRMTNCAAGQLPGRSPMNSFAHARAFASGGEKEFQRPAFDALASSAWLDVAREPMILSIPETAGRYYIMQMHDMWGEVFAAPGTRALGPDAVHLAVTGPGWTGELPPGLLRIDAPTPYIWVRGHTQTRGPQDYEAVHRIQDGYRITPLSLWRSPRGAVAPKDAVAAKADAPRRIPGWDVNTSPVKRAVNMTGTVLFAYAAEALKLHPTHLTDQAVLARAARIGLQPGAPFDAKRLRPQVMDAIEQGAMDARRRMNAWATLRRKEVDGWRLPALPIGVYGDDYLRRATAAMLELGAGAPDDSFHMVAYADADGRSLDGANRYVVRFPQGAHPPAAGFWSLTVYDKYLFPSGNSLQRYALGSGNPLALNDDGSLEVYIQAADPGGRRRTNWLPAPAGPISLSLRLHHPAAPALDGKWTPPPVERVAETY